MAKHKARKQKTKGAKREARGKRQAWLARRAAWLEKQAAQEPKAARSTPRKSLLLQFRNRPVATITNMFIVYLAAFAPRVEGSRSQMHVQFDVTDRFSLGINTGEPRIGKVDSTNNSTREILAMHLNEMDDPSAPSSVIGDRIDLGTSPPTNHQTTVAAMGKQVDSFSYTCEGDDCFAAWPKLNVTAETLGSIVVKRLDGNFSVDAQVEVSVPIPETPDCPAVKPLISRGFHVDGAYMSVGDDAVVVTFNEDVERGNATKYCDIERNRVVVLDRQTLEKKYSGVVVTHDGGKIAYSNSLGIALKHRQMLLLTFENNDNSGARENNMIFDRRSIDGSPISRDTLTFDHFTYHFAVDCHEQANRVAIVESHWEDIGDGVVVIAFRSSSLDGQSASSPVVIAQLHKHGLIQDLEIERVKEASPKKDLQKDDYLVSWVEWIFDYDDPLAPMVGTSKVQIVRDSKPLGQPMTIKPEGQKNCFIVGSDVKPTREGMVVGIEEGCQPGGAYTPIELRSRVEVGDVIISNATGTTGKETTTTGNKAEVSDSQSQSGLPAGAVVSVVLGAACAAAGLATAGFFAFKRYAEATNPARELYQELDSASSSGASSGDDVPPIATTPLAPGGGV